jgi:hypothetical protein
MREVVLLEVERPCFNEFPDQCAGCPEYRETRQDQTEQLAVLTGLGMLYSPYIEKTVKECKRYHKRKVEYLR